MELIKVTQNDNGEQFVSARELHKKLEITERFSSWFDRMLKYGFIENVDFTSVKSFTVVNNGAKKEIDEYILKLDMAKQISMLQRNELGTKFRMYFIECEKKLKQIYDNSKEKLLLDIIKSESEVQRAVALNKYEIEYVKPLEIKIEQDKHKVVLAESIANSEDLILVRELAKILKQNKIETGEQRLFSWLRENGFLIKKHGTDYNMPTQKSINLGIMRVVESTKTTSEKTIICKTTKITPKGQTYFINKFLRGN